MSGPEYLYAIEVSPYPIERTPLSPDWLELTIGDKWGQRASVLYGPKDEIRAALALLQDQLEES